MFTFPKNLPDELISALKIPVQVHAARDALPFIAKAILKLFKAESCICYFDDTPDPAVGPVCSYYQADLVANSAQATDVASSWAASGINSSIRKDLEARLAALSYSAFSWPYPRIPIMQSPSCSFPRDYTLFLPFSSDLTLRQEGESLFFGYLALFFNNFPILQDETVRLIIALPELLSACFAAYLRQNSVTNASDLGVFAHDTKRHLLVAREFLSTIKESDKARRSAAIEALERSIIRMLRHASSILLNDRDEHGNLKLSLMEGININDVLVETVEELRPLFAHAGVTLSVDYGNDCLVTIDPAIFPAAIGNLLDNALKFSKKGDTVILKSYSLEGKVIVDIKDEGVPIAAGEEQRVFEKRFRGSNSKGKAGNGLGLYFVRRLVELHNGKICLQQQNGKKIFQISLPSERNS